ncbi:hypothetical protein PRUB_a1284 [Pseudoalteromonas rubra]|uniref:Uncharacterized protein n=1 Tax=Pseudoalteromonas rubra TaxID=43658 RepID=A0A8T0C7B8_9GAMM|nr:hypothetical protein PRUB_a1284 [Pseudoalteromonas rubra]
MKKHLRVLFLYPKMVVTLVNHCAINLLDGCYRIIRLYPFEGTA